MVDGLATELVVVVVVARVVVVVVWATDVVVVVWMAELLDDTAAAPYL